MKLLKNGEPSKKGTKKPVGFGEKISLARKGMKFSAETKRKMSESKKGNKNSIGNKSTLGKIGPSGNAWKKDRSKIIGRHNRNVHDPDYKQWRKAVFDRDNYRCQIGQDCKGRLEAHHILGWKSHPELRYEVSNGITLCHLHHPRKRKDEVKLSSFFQTLVTSV